MKASIKIYRTIGGVKYEQVTSDPSEFEALKKECKENKIKFRIVNGDFLKAPLIGRPKLKEEEKKEPTKVIRVPEALLKSFKQQINDHKAMVAHCARNLELQKIFNTRKPNL